MQRMSERATEQYDLPLPSTRRGRLTRARLLVAAEDVFGSVGYERASITAITQAAGVAQGTFYGYFPSKHAVFVELIRDFATRVRGAIAASSGPVAAAGGSRAEIERGGIQGWLTFCADHPGLYRVMREAMFFAPETHRWYYESFVAAYADSFVRLSGEHPAIDLESLGFVMIAIADWLGLKWIVWERRRPPDCVVDQITALLDRGLTGLLGHPTGA